MSRGNARSAELRHQSHGNREQTGHEQSTDVQAIARKYGAFNAIAGLLGFVGPAIWGNDDDGLVNLESGLFLGVVAVNGPHALLHTLHGLHGMRASRDPESARSYMRLSVAFFAIFAAVGWQKFGFERGVHEIAGLAVDGWGNLGHTVLSGIGILALVRTGPGAKSQQNTESRTEPES